MSYNPFEDIHLKLQYNKGHIVYWAIDPLFPDENPHEFTLQVSGTVDFSELLREIPVGNKFFAEDLPNAQQNFSALLYYRVKLSTPKGEYFSDSVSSYLTPSSRRQYRLANEIVRKELLRMTKFSGIPSYVLKRKTYGVPSKDYSKVDPITGAALTSEKNNYGNHFDTGYYDPVSTMFSQEDGHDTFKLDPAGTGTVNRSDMSVRMVGFPLVHYNDILIDIDQDYRYLIKDRQEITFPGTSIVMIQLLQVSLLPTTDPIYKYELP